MANKPGVAPATVAAAKADSSKASKVVDSALLKSPFGAATVGTQQFVTIENKDILVKLSTQAVKYIRFEVKKL